MSYHSRSQVTNARPLRRNDIAASITSALTSAAMGSGVYLVKIVNETGSTAYVRPVQAGGSVSAANGEPILDSSVSYMSVRPGEYLAGILATGSGTLRIVEMSL